MKEEEGAVSEMTDPQEDAFDGAVAEPEDEYAADGAEGFAEEDEESDEAGAEQAADEDGEDADDEYADEPAAEVPEPPVPATAEDFREALRRLPGDWYVVHSYAGYENRVKQNLETRIQSLNMEDYIFQIEVPMEEAIEVKNGQRKKVRRNKFPGYVLVRMDLTPDSWGAVRNTPGVTGFVGNAHEPFPLTTDEVVKILMEERAAGGRLAEAAGRGQGARLRGGRLGDRHRRPVRHPSGDDRRDQRRVAEDQGPGRDLRPGDLGRAVLRSNPEELTRL